MDNNTKKTIEFERFIAMLRTTKRTGKLVSLDTAIKISGCNQEHLYHAVRRSMETDSAAGRPFIASFLVGKNNQPIPQYFQYAKELGIDIQNPSGWWKGQLTKLGVSNVQNIIRTINAGDRQHGQRNGQRNGHGKPNNTFSETTRSFYEEEGLSVSGTPTGNGNPDHRSRGRRGGRGRQRSTETIITGDVI